MEHLHDRQAPGQAWCLSLYQIVRRPAAEEKPELVSARSIKAPAIWDILGHHERQVVLVNIPLTYPPRPVNGGMVTGLLTPRSAPGFTFPAGLSSQITDYKFDLDRFVDKTPFLDEIDGDIVAPTLESCG